MNYFKVLFFLKDIFSCRKLTAHYGQIDRHFKGLRIDNDLNKLLTYTTNSIPFYKKFQNNDLNSFPVINKVIIKANEMEFLNPSYQLSKLIKMTTSGSTGTPFTVYQDLNKKARNHADALFFGEMGGYEIGNKLYYLKIWAKQKMASPFMYKLQNIVPIDVIDLDELKIHQLVTEIELSNEKISFLGYVSALEHFIRSAVNYDIKTIRANIVSVITMSEGLPKETKTKLEKIFGCPVVSRYSNLENGIIAQQERNSDLFLVNTASFYVEIFHPTKDELLSDGELGRIVVTDLFNYAMPMIRYDTGDFGIRIKKDGKTYLQSVEGRKLDLLYDTKGNMVSSYIMYKNMWQYTEIEQYQLVQTHIKSYEFKINCPGGFQRENKLVAEFKKYLGNDADFRVIYVDEIPLLDSGKRRKTVNLYYK